MGHCVGSYIGAVEMGECVILTVDLDDIHYTLEVSAVVKDDGLAGYHLCQMQSKYNGGVKNPEHRNQVITFLNNIDLSIRKRKTKKKKGFQSFEVLFLIDMCSLMMRVIEQ